MLNDSMAEYVRMIMDRRSGMFDTLIFKFMQQTGAKPEDIMLVEESGETGFKFYYAKKKKADVAYPPEKEAMLKVVGQLLEDRFDGADSVILFLLSSIFPISKKTRFLVVQAGSMTYTIPVYTSYEPLIAATSGYKKDKTDIPFTRDEVELNVKAGKYRIGYSESANIVLVSLFDI